MSKDQKLLTKIKSSFVMDSDIESVIESDSDIESKLLLPYTYISQVPGKQVRKKIVMALNHWLQIPDDKMKNILELIQMLHVGSLLVDDIEDNTNMRRGVPSAHRVYGVPLTINAACHIFFLALNKSFAIDHRIPKIVTQELLKAHRGQGMEIYWRDTFICPTEDQYKEMILLKTGSFFMCAYRLMQLFSENRTDYSKLLNIIGFYFQIRDDYCNLIHPEELEEWPRKEEVQESLKGSNFCDDVTEGKFSLSVIHALQTAQGVEILNILRQRTKDVSVKKHFVYRLEKLGSMQYTRDVLRKMDLEARAEVSKLGGNPFMEALLDELCAWKTDGLGTL